MKNQYSLITSGVCVVIYFHYIRKSSFLLTVIVPKSVLRFVSNSKDSYRFENKRWKIVYSVLGFMYISEYFSLECKN